MLRVAILSLVSILSADPAEAQQSLTGPNKIYDVTFHISDGPKVIGIPKLRMKLGQAATITNSADNGYSLKALLQANRSRPDDLQVTVDLKLAQNHGWVMIGKPSLSMGLNQPTSVVLGAAHRPPVTIEVSVSDAAPNMKLAG